MGQGQDKIARSLVDLQPTAIVELFLLYFNTVDKENAFIAFHGGANFTSSIKWQGIDYIPLPVESEGFEVSANGQMARPKIRISNKDYFMTDLLANNQDLQFAKIFRKRTFVKYLDDDNFDGGNPWGQADASAEISNDTFVISQKTSENKLYVEFELSSPLDLENFEVNNRLIMSRYCSWYYRGNGCNYDGPPLETEDGRVIYLNINNVNNWPQIYSNSNWQTGVSYSSGDSVFLENKKIIINRPYSEEQKTSYYAKIWYVCNQNHISTLSNQPDLNQTYWTRDGCNKKLDGCRKRFQNSETQVLPSTDYLVNNYYVDFSNLTFLTNNLSKKASITGSSISDLYGTNAISANGFQNVANDVNYYKSTTLPYNDNYNAWVSSGNNDPWIQLSWDSPQTINRIDLYDRPNPYININDIKIYYKYANGSEDFGSLNNIPTNGTKVSTGFANKIVTGVLISGVSSSSMAGLTEVQIFSPSGIGLYNTSFKNDNIFLKEDIHIATCFTYPKGRTEKEKKMNIFHNVRRDCQYSGINLYLVDDWYVLDFATVEVSGNAPSYTVKNKSISGKFSSSNTLKYIHLECYGGKTNGTLPTLFPEGSITISDQEGVLASYSLKNKDLSNKFSGEFFTFKNTSYTGGVGDLFFGINNWEVPKEHDTSNGGKYPYPSDMQTTNNFKLGATAIWTGKQGLEDRKEFFNRSEENIWDVGSIHSAPRDYQELISYDRLLQSGLYVWWDMDISNVSPYQITGSNNSSKILNFSGEYSANMEVYDPKNFKQKISFISQSPLGYLPFGGFPATDKYGR